MKTYVLGVVLGMLLLPLLACGGSESEPAARPGSGGMQAKPAKRPPPPADPEAARQALLGLVVWDSSEPARDLDTDAATCTERTEAVPDAKRGTHPLVAVQRWIQCMEELGWSQKKKS
ncbi:MAG: hypothetical protein QNK04_01005 [Myxococcota bacterium]|nr:hypothetical protein [Myxococcota bacterium]